VKTPDQAAMNAEMLARGVRAHLITYAKALRASLDAGVPARTLVEWGIPWHDIQTCQEAPTAPVQVPCRGCMNRETSHPSGICAICRAITAKPELGERRAVER
jgi:hypothetical protein